MATINWTAGAKIEGQRGQAHCSSDGRFEVRPVGQTGRYELWTVAGADDDAVRACKGSVKDCKAEAERLAGEDTPVAVQVETALAPVDVPAVIEAVPESMPAAERATIPETDAVQDVIDSFVWSYGLEFMSRPDSTDLLAAKGLTTDQVTSAGLKRADRNTRRRLADGAKALNADPKTRVNVVQVGDSETDPAAKAGLPTPRYNATPNELAARHREGKLRLGDVPLADETETADEVSDNQEESGTVYVSEKNIKALLVSMGKEIAGEWPANRIQQWIKVKLAHFLANGAKEPEDKGQMAILRNISKAIAAGEEVVIGEKPAKKAKANDKSAKPAVKVKPTNGTAAKKDKGNPGKNGKLRSEPKPGTVSGVTLELFRAGPVSKEVVAKKLEKKFPDHSPDSMRDSITWYLSNSRGFKAMGLTVTKSEEGFLVK